MTRSEFRDGPRILLVLIAAAACGHSAATSDDRRNESDECAADVVENPQDADVRARLAAARVGVDFDSVRFDQAVEYLARISGTKIVILPAVREGRSDEELTITNLKLETPLPVDQILGLITKLAGLTWNVENGVVQITTIDAARGPFVVKLYDVRDIVIPRADFPGTQCPLVPSDEPTDETAPPR